MDINLYFLTIDYLTMLLVCNIVDYENYQSLRKQAAKQIICNISSKS